jgi:hypothetical protein
MADPVLVPNTVATGEYDPLQHINDGFLGTGYSTAMELSFIVLAVIVIGVAYSTYRYFLPETSIFRSIASAIGLREV